MKYLWIALTSLLVSSACFAVSRGSQEAVKNQTAKDTLSQYRAQLRAARTQCIAGLQRAEREATAQGDTEEVARIQRTLKAVRAHSADDVFDPFAALRADVQGSKWLNASSPANWNRFESANKMKNSKGEGGKWAVVDENTIASTVGVRYIYLWVFNEDRSEATLQRFNFDRSHKREFRRAPR